jgi:hypothetical protein
MAKTKEETETPQLVTVTATTALFEAGERYAAGDSFETTPERASALGETVTIAG